MLMFAFEQSVEQHRTGKKNLAAINVAVMKDILKI